jgi:hypothetical protein
MKLYAGIAPDAKRQAQRRANPTLESAYGPDIARKARDDRLSKYQTICQSGSLLESLLSTPGIGVAPRLTCGLLAWFRLGPKDIGRGTGLASLLRLQQNEQAYCNPTSFPYQGE